MSDDNNGYRPRPAPRPELVPRGFREGELRQETEPRAPTEAIHRKGAELRDAMRSGRLDYGDLYERFVDLWEESRMAVHRAKHSQAGRQVTDPRTNQKVLSFTVDESAVLAAINTTRNVLDSLVKVRKVAGTEATPGIPRWAISSIERSLRNHPEALKQLLMDLAAEHEKAADEVEE